MKQFLDQFVHGKKTYFVAAMALGYLAGGYMGWWPVNDDVLKGFGFAGLVTLRHALSKLGAVNVLTADFADSTDSGAPNATPIPPQASMAGASNPSQKGNGITAALGMAFLIGLAGKVFLSRFTLLVAAALPLTGCALLDKASSAVSSPRVTVVTNTVTVVQTNLLPVAVAVPGETRFVTNNVEKVVTNVVEKISTVTNFVEKAGIAEGIKVAQIGAAVAPPPYGPIAAGVLGVVSAGLGLLVRRKNSQLQDANDQADSLASQLQAVVKGVEQTTTAIDPATGEKVKAIIAQTSKALGVSDDLHATVQAITS